MAVTTKTAFPSAEESVQLLDRGSELRLLVGCPVQHGGWFLRDIITENPPTLPEWDTIAAVQSDARAILDDADYGIIHSRFIELFMPYQDAIHQLFE